MGITVATFVSSLSDFLSEVFEGTHPGQFVKCKADNLLSQVKIHPQQLKAFAK
jgi:hypothetical protein